MSPSRRALLRMSTGAFASAVTFGLTKPAMAAASVAAPALIGLNKLDVRSLSFDCVNAGEQYKPIDYWVEGAYVPEALAAINHALRDFWSGEVHKIEPKLLDALYLLRSRLETDQPFALTSGYRSPKTNAMLHQVDLGVAVHSLHMKGQAADICIPGRPLDRVHNTALAMRVGGVGYYPNDNFIHVDVGRVRRWEG